MDGAQVYDSSISKAAAIPLIHSSRRAKGEHASLVLVRSASNLKRLER